MKVQATKPDGTKIEIETTDFTKRTSIPGGISEYTNKRGLKVQLMETWGGLKRLVDAGQEPTREPGGDEGDTVTDN